MIARVAIGLVRLALQLLAGFLVIVGCVLLVVLIFVLLLKVVPT